MATGEPTGAQQAVDIVAAVMAGRPAAEVRGELVHWLSRRDAVLAEPLLSTTVAAIASGSRILVLPAAGRAAGRGAVTVPVTQPSPAVREDASRVSAAGASLSA